MGSEGRELTDYQRHLRSAQPEIDVITSPSDSAPEFGGALKRKKQGKDVPTPIVTQLGLPEGDHEPLSTRLVNTGRKLKPPTPIERLGTETAEGHQDPVTRQKARRQALAIRRNLQKRGRSGR